MPAKQFVAHWKAEKAHLLRRALEPGSLVAEQLAALALSDTQRVQLERALDTLLSDTLYTLLLGLDGCAEIGGEQQTYSITDESGAMLGSLESEAYEQFHGDA